MIQAGDFPYKNMSLLAAGHRLGVPVTVHVAIGTDIIHMHPSFDGKATGEAAHRDFLTFCSLVSELEGGVYINLGSAVLLPEIFLKAVTLVRNIGQPLRHFTTVNMDFVQHYRPNTNVVRRPTQGGGRGFALTGHHEIMFPLLAAAIIEQSGLIRTPPSAGILVSYAIKKGPEFRPFHGALSCRKPIPAGFTKKAI